MIEFESVSKEFPGGAQAVDDFSLKIPSRTTTVFVGSSGCGKTTLLRMINRMVEPTSGAIAIDGTDISTRNKVELRRSIGYVMQHAGLLPHRKVLENIATVLLLNGVKKTEALERSRNMMGQVGLAADLTDRYPAQLSGGQQQRVGVARALVADPNILLMDEPFGAVDPIVRAELQNELLRLQRDLDKTIVFVTHDIDEAFLLGDQVVIVETGGKIAQAGAPADILAEPANEFVADFIGLGRGQRSLRIEKRHDKSILVDEHGKAVGILAGDDQ